MASSRRPEPQGGVLQADDLILVVRVVVVVVPVANVAAVAPREGEGELAVEADEDDGLAVPDAPRQPEQPRPGDAERAEAERRVERGHEATALAGAPELWRDRLNLLICLGLNSTSITPKLHNEISVVHSGDRLNGCNPNFLVVFNTLCAMPTFIPQTR